MYGSSVSSREKRTLLRKVRDSKKSLGYKCYDRTSQVSNYLGKPISNAKVCIDYTKPLDLRYTGKKITRSPRESIKGWIHGEEWDNWAYKSGWWRFKKLKRYFVKYPAKLTITPSSRTFSYTPKTYDVTSKVRSVLGGDIIKATLYVDYSRPIRFIKYGTSKPRSRSMPDMVRGWQSGIEKSRDQIGSDYYWVDYPCRLQISKRTPAPSVTPQTPGITPAPSVTPQTPSMSPIQGGMMGAMPGVPKVSADGKYLIITLPNKSTMKIPLPPSPPIPSVDSGQMY